MDRGYTIKFANGKGFFLVASEETNDWLENYASILELKSCKKSKLPKMIFIKKNVLKKNGLNYVSQVLRIKNLPRKGWITSYRNPGITTRSNKKVKDLICELYEKEGVTDFDKMFFSLYPLYKEVIEEGGLIVHTGLVEYNGKGFLLAAKGHTGKSTCCRRIPSPWKALCDDLALVILDNNKYKVHPLPTWSEYRSNHSKIGPSWDIQHNVPLSGIFFLEQAKFDEVVHLGKMQAAAYLYDMSSCNCQGLMYIKQTKLKDKEFINTLFNNSCNLVQKIPTFILRVSLTGRFWKNMEEVIKTF